jgi:hypothetical protein
VGGEGEEFAFWEEVKFEGGVSLLEESHEASALFLLRLQSIMVWLNDWFGLGRGFVELG